MRIIKLSALIIGLVLIVSTASLSTAQQNSTTDLLLIGNSDSSSGTFMYTMRPDGSELELINAQPFLTRGWLSPDNNWLYLSAGKGSIIYRFSVQDKQLSNLTLEQNLTGMPFEFSADGNHAFFRKHDSQTQIGSLWMMNLDGSEQQQLVSSSTLFLYHAFSPDKQWFYFIDTERRPSRLNLETFAVERIDAPGFLPDDSMWMQWINDEWIVYHHHEIGQPTIVSLMRLDGSDLQDIAILEEAYDYFGFGWHNDEWVVLNRNNGTAHCIKLDGTGKEYLATFDKPHLSIEWASPEVS